MEGYEPQAKLVEVSNEKHTEGSENRVLQLNSTSQILALRLDFDLEKASEEVDNNFADYNSYPEDLINQQAYQQKEVKTWKNKNILNKYIFHHFEDPVGNFIDYADYADNYNQG